MKPIKTEKVEVEKIIGEDSDGLPWIAYKIPSGCKGEVLIVHEDPIDVSITPMTEKQWDNLLAFKNNKN